MAIIHIDVTHWQGRTAFPQRVRCNRGDEVRWQLKAPRGYRWRIYFHHGTPFASQTEMEVESDTGESASIGATADNVGTFKYGIEVADPDGAPVTDDDPWLEVVP